MRMWIMIAIAGVAACVVSGCVLATPEMVGCRAKLTVKVVDEEGIPIKELPVWTCFSYQKPVEGKSDVNGLFSLEGKSFNAAVAYHVRQTGYYLSQGSYQFVGVDEKDKIRLPWDPVVTMVVRRVVNPIPMYAKRINIGMPEFEKPLGYDLMVGDWVGPHGRGVNSDFVFTAKLDRRSDLDYDYELKITFSSIKDGIQELSTDDKFKSSVFQWPYITPQGGYPAQWVQIRNRAIGKGETGNRNPKKKYIFRVRTELNAKGEIISAMYGKINGDFMDFTYYLNPTPNDLNLEFDPKRNLMKGMSPMEQVNEP